MSYKRERQHRADQLAKNSQDASDLAPGAVTLVEAELGAVQRKATHKNGVRDGTAPARSVDHQASLDGVQFVPGETADAFRDVIEGIVSVQRSRAASAPNTAHIERHAAAGVSGTGGAVPHAAQMEAAFGTSFADVSAHTGPEAAAACDAVGAHAYTTGSHVAFKTASPSLDLVAHELTHVLQQRSGVQAKGAGESPALEGEADDVGARVARSESVADVARKYGASSGSGQYGIQRKANADGKANSGAQAAATHAAPVGQKEAWPGGPTGDKVERINFLDTDTIISMVKSQCRNMDIEQNGLSGHLLDIFSGSYFYGDSAWRSGWIDDGWNDTWSAGLSDVDMLVNIQLSIVNPRERSAEHVDSTATAGASGTASNTSSSTSTVGGNAEVSGGVGGNGNPTGGAKLGGNTSQADTATTTTGNTGSRSDTASYKNKRMIAGIQMTVTVRYNATIPGADYSPNRGTFNVGNVIYLRKEI